MGADKCREASVRLFDNDVGEIGHGYGELYDGEG